MKDLLLQFMEAATFSTPSKYTLNQDAAQTITYTGDTYSYSYPMTAVNLWDGLYSWYDAAGLGATYSAIGPAGDGCYYGPMIFDCSKFADFTANYPAYGSLKPYGIMLMQVGTAASDTVTVTLSSGGSTDQVFSLMAQ